MLYFNSSVSLKSQMNLNLTIQDLLRSERSSIFEVRLKQSQVLRAAGNESFAENKIDEAVTLYERAMYHADFEESQISFEFTESHKLELFNTVYPIRLNIARCALSQNRYRDALSSLKLVTQGIDISYVPPSVRAKVHYLSAKVYTKLGEFENAEKEVVLSLEFAPTDTAVLSLHREIKAFVRQEKKRFKESWKDCLPKTDEAAPQRNSASTKPTSSEITPSFISYITDRLPGLTMLVISFAMALTAMYLYKIFYL